MKMIEFHSVVLGCDPEFFFRKGRKIVGSEKVIPPEGILVGDEESKLIIDGVQAEMNPAPNTCREVLGENIARCFYHLGRHLRDFNDIVVDFAQTIHMSDDEFSDLSENSKKFGCMPSKNLYDGGKDGKITVNPSVYRYRSAGGHIHLGGFDAAVVDALKNKSLRVIQMMDILVGNTAVLLDRDPGNVERRKVYGRAGEFRTPSHGLEYRTLSNFWIRNYQLMSLVMGLARQAVIIVVNDLDGEFAKLVDMKDVSNAINKNDFGLALANFKKIQDLLLAITPDTDAYPITRRTIVPFKHFVNEGIDRWFKESPLDSWQSYLDGNDRIGIYDYLLDVVKPTIGD